MKYKSIFNIKLILNMKYILMVLMSIKMVTDLFIMNKLNNDRLTEI